MNQMPSISILLRTTTKGLPLKVFKTFNKQPSRKPWLRENWQLMEKDLFFKCPHPVAILCLWKVSDVFRSVDKQYTVTRI